MALVTGFEPVVFRSTGGCSNRTELNQQKERPPTQQVEPENVTQGVGIARDQAA